MESFRTFVADEREWIITLRTMDKSLVFDALIAALRREMESFTAASKDAADYATNEEARATSQYDTQNIEASYLARGQAAQVRQVAELIETLLVNRDRLTASYKKAEEGALVEVDLGGPPTEWFFLAPGGGGEECAVDGLQITVISPQAPLCQSLHGKGADSSFDLPNGRKGKILRVE